MRHKGTKYFYTMLIVCFILMFMITLAGAINNNYKLCGEPVYISYDYCKEYQLKKEN